MSKPSLSDAVKELERLRDEGYLTQGQFIQEMHELMRQADRYAPLPPGGSARQAGQAGLGDMVDHSAPEAFDEGVYAHFNPTGAQENDQAPVMPQRESPVVAAPVAEAGRVIVQGKVPWDDQGSSRVSLEAGRADETDNGTAAEVEDKNKLNPVQRENLARMASKTIKTLNRKKNPQLVLVLSLLWPGLGQAYIGKTGSGAALMLVGGAGWAGLWFGEFWILYILPALGFLCGAIAHRDVLHHNGYIDRKQRLSDMNQQSESSLNVEKSIRQHGAKPAVRNH